VFQLCVVSSQQLTSEKPHNGAINCVCNYAVGTDFAERCRVLFNRVMHEQPVLMCKSYLLESQYFQKFRALEHSSDLSGEVQPNQLKYRNSLYLCCLLPVWYWFQNQIRVYSSGCLIPAECLWNTYKKHFVFKNK